MRGQHLCLAQVERSSSQANFGVCSHFFSVSPQTKRNCVVGFLKKILQHPFAPTLPRRACTRVSPFGIFPCLPSLLPCGGKCPGLGGSDPLRSPCSCFFSQNWDLEAMICQLLDNMGQLRDNIRSTFRQVPWLGW